MTRTGDDTGTDRRLLLLVGLVVVFAASAAVASLYAIGSAGAVTTSDLQMAAILIFLVAVATAASVKVRIRSSAHGIQWTEVAFMIGLAVAPAGWVVLCTGLGVAITCLLQRRATIKTIFGVAKDMVLVSASGLVLNLFGWQWQDEHSLIEIIGPFIAAYLIAVLLDDLLTMPVIALDTGTKLAHIYRVDWLLRLSSAIVRFPLIMGILAILQVGSNPLLAVIPPLVLSLHLTYSSRVRARTEQQAWQRLAQATDALNVVDLDTVLTTSVTQAAELFSADEVEVELHQSTRLVRGTSDAITHDGSADAAPASDGSVIPMRLEGPDSATDIGVLRLRFRGPVRLSERERYTLRTFTSALCTAIRNASAYAELERIAGENAYAATHDALTDLANRRHLIDRGTELLSQQRALGITALLLIDLNHFKEINDTLGHAAGDRMLVQVADRLRAAADNDALVARLGGDEFAVLFSGLPAPAVAAHRAEAMLAALHQPLDLDGMRLSVEASGGVAVAPSSGGMAELLRRADVAMYQAKRSGRRVVSYSRAHDTVNMMALGRSGESPHRGGEHKLSVDFQPIVDLLSGEVVAAEALARWEHPRHGSIDPLRFLDITERSGMLPTFVESILDQSLIMAKIWHDAGFDLPVAVNVSPRSLLDARFPGSVLARLRAHDLPPDRLFLELAEPLAISQLEVVDQVLGQLRDEGVRLALDDFGTGYSSLSVLSRIPVHKLKIDQAFVTAMETSDEATAVIRSTVELGRSLNLAVVAEGVESEPQRRTLWELGCVAGQGHLFSRPLPGDRLLAALHRGSAGRPGSLALPLHHEGAVIRLPSARRPSGRGRGERLPHLPA